MTTSQYRFIKNAINKEVEAAKKAWNEAEESLEKYTRMIEYLQKKEALEKFESFCLAQ